MYYDDLLFLGPEALPISTSLFDFALLGQLGRHGFATGMPCQVTLAAIDNVPKLSVSHDTGLTFLATASA